MSHCIMGTVSYVFREIPHILSFCGYQLVIVVLFKIGSHEVISFSIVFGSSIVLSRPADIPCRSAAGETLLGIDFVKNTPRLVCVQNLQYNC